MRHSLAARIWVSLAVLVLATCGDDDEPTDPSGCTSSTECAVPLACEARQCVDRCTSDDDCSAGSVCLDDEEGRHVCVRVPMPDAGRLDMGPDDMGVRDAGADTGGRDASGDDTGPPEMDAGPLDMGPDEPDAFTPDAGPTDSGSMDAGPPDLGPTDSGPTDSGPFDAGPPVCPPVGSRAVVNVPQGVLPDSLTHWTCDNLYVLNGIVAVHSTDPSEPQELVIDPGVVVHGLTGVGDRAFLVVSRSGRIRALGTAAQPIVFTSSRMVGMRAREDWGGITLLGRATAGGTRRTEGFAASVPGVSDLDALLAYGPIAPAAADDAWDCGTLRYVRVEFASFNAGGAMGNESNGIQIYSCGWGTRLDHVQVHLSGDDGVEIFGGTVDVSHLLVTGASDDGFDWDDGWAGRAQFLAVQQHPGAGDFGIEAGGGSETPALAPNPRIFNATLIGTNGMGGQIGIRLRGASRGYLRNFIFSAFTDGYLDIGGAAAVANLMTDPPLLSVRNTVLHQGGAPSGWPTGSDDAADGDFIEQDYFSAAAQLNQLVDPMLVAPFDTTSPDLTPRAGAPLGADRAEAPSEVAGDTRPPFFDTTADYVGAFAPSGADWTDGWTAFPTN